MNLYAFLVSTYNTFLGLFPSSVQWLVTLLIVVGIIGAFVSLIHHHAVGVVILILLLPFLIPVFQHFFADIYNFFLYLLQTLRITAPQP